MALVDWQQAEEKLDRVSEPGFAARIAFDAATQLGFTSMFLGEIPVGTERMEKQMLFTLPGDKWPLHYSRRGFRHVDPIILLLKSFEFEIVYWDDCRAMIRANTHAQQMYQEAAQIFGLEDGMIVWTLTPNITLGYHYMAGPKGSAVGLSRTDRLEMARCARVAIMKEAKHSEVYEVLPHAPALTQKQREILSMVMECHKNQEIADHFNVTRIAVEKQITALFEAFKIPNDVGVKRIALVQAAQRCGLVPIEPVLTKHSQNPKSKDVPN